MPERQRILDLPFTLREWQFFAAVIAANLVINISAMWVENRFLILGNGSDVPAGFIEATEHAPERISRKRGNTIERRFWRSGGGYNRNIDGP